MKFARNLLPSAVACIAFLGCNNAEKRATTAIKIYEDYVVDYMAKLDEPFWKAWEQAAKNSNDKLDDKNKSILKGVLSKTKENIKPTFSERLARIKVAGNGDSIVLGLIDQLDLEIKDSEQSLIKKDYMEAFDRGDRRVWATAWNPEQVRVEVGFAAVHLACAKEAKKKILEIASKK